MRLRDNFNRSTIRNNTIVVIRKSLDIYGIERTRKRETERLREVDNIRQSR